MVEQRQAGANGDQALSAPARSIAIAAAGVSTGEDFAALMSALMSDVIEGRIAPAVSNAACNAGGKLLKVVEMQYKYATQATDSMPVKPSLRLAPVVTPQQTKIRQTRRNQD